MTRKKTAAPMTTQRPDRNADHLDVVGYRLAVRWLAPQDFDADSAKLRGLASSTPRPQPTLVFLHEALGSIGQWKDCPDALFAANRLPGLL